MMLSQKKKLLNLKGSKEGHKYFAASSLLCMIMAIYTGHKMISGKSRKKKEVSVESVED